MLVGDSTLRQAAGQQRQLCHRCFSTYNQVPFGGAPCTGQDTAALPPAECHGGIRTTITFPTCWDGVNLDPSDHQSRISLSLSLPSLSSLSLPPSPSFPPLSSLSPLSLSSLPSLPSLNFT